MLFSIIVPHHNESKKEISPLMRSIDSQAGIDFNELEIILVKDKEETPLDKEQFKEFPNIRKRVVKLQSPYPCNPGMSRQIGLDNAKGDYIIFCDADDCLYHVCALREIKENIEVSHADVYRTKFIEEIGTPDDPNKRFYQLKELNWIWVFAKVYKKEFLTRHNLRFHEKLRWHEDNYFNTLCSYCEPQVVDLTNTPFYLWRYSASSVTRLNNHEYTFNSIDELLDARDLAYEVIIKDYKKNCARDILYLITREYLVLIDPVNRDKEKYLQIAKRYYEFVKKFTPDLINGVYAPDLEAFILEVYKQSDSKFLPDMSLGAFLRELYKLFEAPPTTAQPQIAQGN